MFKYLLQSYKTNNERKTPVWSRWPYFKLQAETILLKVGTHAINYISLLRDSAEDFRKF